MTRPLRFPLALLAPLLACASAGAQAGGADAALGDPTFAVALSDTVRSASIDPALARSARFGARRGGGVAGGYRSVVADFPTGEGSALVYAPIGDLRTGGLQREQVDFHLRYVDADGIATPGPTITYRFVGGLTAATGKPAGGRGRLSSRALPQPSSRPLEASGSRARATSYPSFVGGTDYTAYALTERPAADDRFARTRLYFYDEAGGLPVAARTAVEYQLEFADLLGRRVTTSRYGGVVACAVLTSRRTDRTAALETSPHFDRAATIVQGRCAMCHALEPTWEGMIVPPKGVVLQTKDEIARQAVEVYLQAARSHAMPPANLSGITEEERGVLRRWFEEAG